jgi:glucose/arabinose dehydrogenase
MCFATPLLAAVALVALAAPAGAQVVLPTGFEDQAVVGGLDFPVGMGPLPDGRVFVIEQFSARIRLIVNGALSSTDPVCVVDQVNTAGGEQGLLGIVVDPGWPARPYVYVHCDATVPGSTIRISRYTVAGDLAFAGSGALSIDPASRRDLINDLPDSAPNHNGGTLRFGLDGRLYDSMGEDAQSCLAQDDSTLHGVILRLDVSRLPSTPGGPPGLDIITPPDNPQVGSSNLRRRLIDDWGLRNPFRFQIDPLDGARFIGDVGESSYEEVDRAATGALNFGWPYFEGPAIHNTACDTSSTVTRPIAWYDRRSQPSAAVIAGPVYRPGGSASQPFPAEYQGDFLFSDYYSGVLRRIKGSGSSWSLAPPVAGQPSSTDWAHGFDTVSDYLLRPDGSIWYCRQDIGPGTGEVRRIAYTAGTGSVTPPTPTLEFEAPYPQPSSGPVTLTFRLGATSPVVLAIYDVRGRRVRRLLGGEVLSAGPHPVVWDGLDDQGRAAASGYYIARLDSGAITRSRQVVRVR